MFSLKLVDTDLFLDMSPTAQNLYFALGMRADDDGFVSSPKKIAKIVNAADNDLDMLIIKGFVLKTQTVGVVVITHWPTNNQIRNDRYIETAYKDEKSLLVIVDGQYVVEPRMSERQKIAYELEKKNSGIPNGNQMATTGKPSIGKVRLGEVSSPPTPSRRGRRIVGLGNMPDRL